MLAATAAVLASAVLHAGWNLLVKRSSDRLIAIWAQFAIAAVPFLPVLVVTGAPEPATYPFIALSAVHRARTGSRWQGRTKSVISRWPIRSLVACHRC